MQITKPQVFTAMIVIAALAFPCYWLAPDYIEAVLVGAIVAESNLAMRLLEKE